MSTIDIGCLGAVVSDFEIALHTVDVKLVSDCLDERRFASDNLQVPQVNSPFQYKVQIVRRFVSFLSLYYISSILGTPKMISIVAVLLFYPGPAKSFKTSGLAIFISSIWL